MLVYNILISLFVKSLAVLSYFSPRLKQLYLNRKYPPTIYLASHDPAKKNLWIHSSSYGEFEGILPLIKTYKEKGDCNIICSFFSSSGFEPLHTHELIDYSIYLPFDTTSRMKQLISQIKPDCLIVSQNEYWPNMIRESLAAGFPVYYVGTYVREKHWWMNSILKFITNPLRNVDRIFIQDQESHLLLKNAGFSNSFLAGNPRIDQVIDNKNVNKLYPKIKSFCGDNMTMVCGSTLLNDDKLIFDVKSQLPNLKVVIVPHDPTDFSVNTIPDSLSYQVATYSTFQDTDIHKQILIVDTFGDLKYLYQFGDIAYVGGGLDEGVHSVLEAAAYLKPILTGPNIKKFKDAVALHELGILHTIQNEEELLKSINKHKTGLNREKSESLRAYLQLHSGSTQRIVDEIRF